MGKKRVIRLHRALSFVIALIVTIVLAVVIYEKSGMLSYQLSNYVNDHYLRGTPFRFSCGRISLTLGGHVSLSRPVIRHIGEDGIGFELFRAESIAFGCDLFQILKLRAIITDLELTDPSIVLAKDDDGNYILPTSRPIEERPASSTMAPHVEVSSFVLDDLSLALRGGDETWTFRDVHIKGSLSWVERVGRLRIEEGSFLVDEKDIAVEDLTLDAQLTDRAIIIDQLEVRTRKSLAIVSGRYEDGRLHHFQAVFNPVDLAEVSVTGVFDEEGELGGNIVVEGAPDSLSVSGSVTGRGLGLVFNGLSFEGWMTEQQIYLSHIQGGVYGARLNGDLKYWRDVNSFEFSGVCEGLDISEGFLPDDEAPSTDLNGFITLQYDAPQDAWEIRGDMRNSVVDGFESREMHFRLGYRETTGLRFREMRLVRPGFEVTASGLIDEKSVVDMILDVRGDSLTYLAEYFDLPDVGGSADLSGRMVGPMSGLRLNLNGTWQDLSYGFVTIDTSDVSASMSDIGNDAFQGMVDLRGRRLSIAGRPFTSPHALIEATQQGVVFRDLSFSRGDTLITGSFDVDDNDGTSRVRVTHLQVKVPEAIWINDRTTTVVIRGESVRLDSLVLASNGQRIGARGEYDAAAETCTFNVWGDHVDLALIGRMAVWPIELSGRATFSGRIRGDINDPTIRVLADVAKGVVDSLSFDRLVVGAAFENGAYRLERFEITHGKQGLSATGKWAFAQSPLSIVRDGYDNKGAASAAVELNVKANRYPLALVFRALHHDNPWGGAFDGDIVIRHTLGSPRIDLTGQVLSLPVDPYRLPAVSTQLVYDNSVLRIDRLEFDDGKTAASLTGRLPVRIGLGQSMGIAGDGRVDLTGSMRSEDLQRVSGYFDAVAESGGKLEGGLKITGTADTPHYSGSVRLTQGSFRLRGTEELLHELAADIELDNLHIVLRSISGKEGKNGQFTGSGWADVEGFHLKRYELSLTLKQVTVSSIPNIRSTQDGQLKLVSHRRADGEVVPMIRGQLDVEEAVISLDLGAREATPSPHTMPTETPAWLCHIDVHAPQNVWLRNTDLNIEMGGDLVVRRDESGLGLRGELSPHRGSYSLYNNKFHVTGGRVDFSTGYGLRPGLYLDAYTPHRRPDQEERRIYLNLHWPPDEPEPKITLSYDLPGYNEADLWRMLGGQVVAGGATTASGAAQNIASSYLERMLNAQMQDMIIDVETRPSDSEVGSGQALSVALSRYLSPDLYLKYRQGISYSDEREVEVEYRVSNIMLLRSEILRHSATISGSSRRQSTDEINFDVKFRWEY